MKSSYATPPGGQLIRQALVTVLGSAVRVRMGLPLFSILQVTLAGIPIKTSPVINTPGTLRLIAAQRVSARWPFVLREDLT